MILQITSKVNYFDPERPYVSYASFSHFAATAPLLCTTAALQLLLSCYAQLISVLCLQMQWLSSLLTLVVVLVQSTWTILAAVAVRLTSWIAHMALGSIVTLGVGVLE